MKARLLTLPLLVVAVGILGMPAASAKPSHPRSTSIVVNPTSGPVGSTFTVTISGLTSSDALQMYVWQGPYASQTVIALDPPVNGTTSATFTGRVVGDGALEVYADQHGTRWVGLGRATFTVT